MPAQTQPFSASPSAGPTPLQGELLLRQIAGNIDEMLWSWDPQSGCISYTNPAFEAFWGWTAATLAGQPWAWLEQVAEADRPAVRQLQLGGPAVMTGQTLDYSVTCANGQTARLRQRVLPVYAPSGELLRVMHLASNITAQVDTSSRLRAEIARRTDSEAQYQAVVENVNEGILITAAGRILYANPKALDLIGLSDAQARAGPFIEFIHPDDRARVLDNHLRRMRGEQVENYYHFRIAHQGVSTRWLQISAVLFNWQGQAATLNFLTDVTLKRQAEQDMRSALLRERELSELKSRFIAVASHEFRTPLAAILSSVELLDLYGDSFPPSEQQALRGQIKTAVARMTGMVDQVLMTSRLASGGFSFTPAALALGPLLAQMVAEADAQAGCSPEGGSGRIALQCDSSLAAPRLADETLLRHILGNLLGNALKYSPPGAPVKLVAWAVGDTLHLLVSDQGIGIPPGDVARLFETFHRGTNVGTVAGTGIGLHIVRQCAELHGGGVSVSSPPGEGATFEVKVNAQLV